MTPPGMDIFDDGRVHMYFRTTTCDRPIINEVIEVDNYMIGSLLLPANSLILDVGAHIGSFSCFAAALFPDAHIRAAEPDPGNFAVLTRNLENLSNAKALHVAVIGVHKPVAWQDGGSNSGGHRVLWEATPGLPPVPAPFMTLAELAADGPPVIGAIKMDCEGSEYDILELAAEDGTLARVVNLLLEYHDFTGRHHEELIPLLETAGFVWYKCPLNPVAGYIWARRPK